MPEITIIISNGEGETATLKAPSDLPLPNITSSIQSALEKCSAQVAYQRSQVKHTLENSVRGWDLDSLGKWGSVDESVVFFPTVKVDAYDLNSVQELIADERSQVQIDSYMLETWSEMSDFDRALSLAALIACYEGVMLTVRFPMDFEIGDAKYCPAPGIVRDLWEKMKGLSK